MQQPLGRHVILELYDCPQHLLATTPFLEETFQKAALMMGATIVSSNFHQFNPYGVSGVVIIQESHLTLHTWPEYNYAAVDIFTCGEIDLEKGVQFLIQALEAEQSNYEILKRGRIVNGLRQTDDGRFA